MEKRVFHLYGDNIVECERIFDLLISAIDVTSYNRYGNASNITLSCSSSIGEFNMIYFPGFGRWTSDVIKYIRDSGGVLREAPDCIMTEVFHGGEKPIFAVEFCSALDAGNQAWQRSGRAYSSAKSGLPYIFLTEIGGYELNPKTREKKVPRLPSPAYLSDQLASRLSSLVKKVMFRWVPLPSSERISNSSAMFWILTKPMPAPKPSSRPQSGAVE